MKISLKRKKLVCILIFLIFILFTITLNYAIENYFIKKELKDQSKAAYVYKADDLATIAKEKNREVVIINNTLKNFTKKYNSVPLKIDINLALGDTIPGSPEDFYQISFFIADNEGFMYVSEIYDAHIKKFDRFGNYIKTFGGKGSGPGELLIPQEMAFDQNENLWIIDKGNQRITNFSRNGEYIYSFQCEILNKAVAGFAIDEKGNFFVSAWDPKSDKTIHKFDSQGRYLFSFGEPVKFPEPLTNKNFVVKKTISRGRLFIYNNKLYYSQCNPYEIRRYSLEGKLELRIFRKNDFMPPSIPVVKGDLISYNMPITSQFLGIWDDKIINFVVGESEDIVDIFNIKGYLINTFRTNKKLSIISSKIDGTIYGGLSEGDNLKLIRFKIIFPK